MSTKKKPKTSTAEAPPIPATPPDIDTIKDDIPPGCTLIKGNHLAQRAKSLGIPFGLARHRVNQWTLAMDGIVILEKDLPKWETKPKLP